MVGEKVGKKGKKIIVSYRRKGGKEEKSREKNLM